MTEPEQSTALDRLVEWLAATLDSFGLNGTRLRWKWNRHRTKLEEAGKRGENLARSARSKHKMCPACRSLVDRGAGRCEACGADLSEVASPGIGRALGNLLPGTSSATSLLLLVNGGLFLLMLLAQLQGTGQPGLFSFDGATLLKVGAHRSYLVWHDGEWWRVVAAMFLHGGLIHFGFNTMVLMQLGPWVEEIYGTARFWVTYLIAGLAGNLLVLFVQPISGGVVGASGAICGLVGMLLAYGIRRGGGMGAEIKRGMIRYSLFILVISFLPGISLLGHAGGFAGGFLVGILLHPGRIRSRTAASLWQLAGVLAILVVLYAFYGVANHGGDYIRHLQ